MFPCGGKPQPSVSERFPDFRVPRSQGPGPLSPTLRPSQIAFSLQAASPRGAASCVRRLTIRIVRMNCRLCRSTVRVPEPQCL